MALLLEMDDVPFKQRAYEKDLMDVDARWEAAVL